MSIPRDGGQAFPCINPHYDGNWNKEPMKSGITIRDYFAAAALSGLLSGDYPGKVWKDGGAPTEAYELADAMIAERAKPKASYPPANPLTNAG